MCGARHSIKEPCPLEAMILQRIRMNEESSGTHLSRLVKIGITGSAFSGSACKLPSE